MIELFIVNYDIIQPQHIGLKFMRYKLVLVRYHVRLDSYFGTHRLGVIVIYLLIYDRVKLHYNSY